jgi:hypothetical protein
MNKQLLTLVAAVALAAALTTPVSAQVVPEPPPPVFHVGGGSAGGASAAPAFIIIGYTAGLMINVGEVTFGQKRFATACEAGLWFISVACKHPTGAELELLRLQFALSETREWKWRVAASRYVVWPSTIAEVKAALAAAKAFDKANR